MVTGTSDVELVLDARADVGEGPTWDAERQELIWVDITRNLVHRFDPETGRDEPVDVGQPVGAAVPRAAGGLALAVRDGFAVLEPASGQVELIAEVEVDNPGNRMNDGKCDSAGRFWAGTMEFEARPNAGALYRLDADRRLVKVLSDVTISNGLGWSLDERTMYYIDSPTHRIDALDYEPASGAVSNRRSLVDFPPEWGLPDGMTVDAEGFLWVAFWDGWAVRRFAPDGGLDVVVELPVSLVTSCAFGGSDLADLYITSASQGLSPEDVRAQPHAGAVFRAQPGVAGLAQHSFRG